MDTVNIWTPAVATRMPFRHFGDARLCVGTLAASYLTRSDVTVARQPGQIIYRVYMWRKLVATRPGTCPVAMKVGWTASAAP